MKISLIGLDKAIILSALYNASKMQGVSFIGGDGSHMSSEKAAGLLKEDTNFDYLNGKVMKIDLGGDVLELWLYDRDNGEGAGLRAIQKHYPSITELTESELNFIQMRAEQSKERVNRDSAAVPVYPIIGDTDTEIPMFQRPLEEQLAYIDTLGYSKIKTFKQKELIKANHRSLHHFKKTGELLHEPKQKNRKPKKVNIQYHKGFFTVNGEVRTKAKSK